MIRFVTILENNFKSYELSVMSFIMQSPIWNAKEWKGLILLSLMKLCLVQTPLKSK